MDTVERDYFLVNGEWLESTSQELPAFQGKTVYELIRVQDGIPLFLEDHLERFRNSAHYIGVPLILEDEEIRQNIAQLIERNRVSEQNLKLLYGQGESGQPQLAYYFVKSFYPPASYYEEGIPVTLFHLKRMDPNVKLQREEYQKAVLAEREKRQVHEILLVDEAERVTEGSRTNLFMVKDNQIWTPPSKRALLGIVRKQVLLICRDLNVEVGEREITVPDLYEAEGLFLTGTGNDVLPIAEVEGRPIPTMTNPLVQEILLQYQRVVDEYKREYRKPE